MQGWVSVKQISHSPNKTLNKCNNLKLCGCSSSASFLSHSYTARHVCKWGSTAATFHRILKYFLTKLPMSKTTTSRDKQAELTLAAAVQRSNWTFIYCSVSKPPEPWTLKESSPRGAEDYNSHDPTLLDNTSKLQLLFGLDWETPSGQKYRLCI